MTRPTRATLRHLAQALGDVLTGARIEKLWRPEPLALLFKIGAIRPRRLLIDLERGHPRVVVTERWPDTPSAPDRQTLILRSHCEGARIAEVRATDERQLALDLARGDGQRVLVAQLAGRYLNAALFDTGDAEIVRLVDKVPPVDRESPALPEGPDPYAGLDHATFLERYAEVSWVERDARSVERRRASVRRAATAWLKRCRRARQAIGRDLERAEAAERDRHRGELLKSALRRIARGATSVAVADWSRPDGAETTIPLDPALDPVANMERFFKRYRKYSGARGRIEERLLSAMEKVEAATALVAEIDAPWDEASAHAERLARLDVLEARLRELGHLPRVTGPRARRAAAGPALPYRAFTTRDGSSILVGKGARDNDRLTFQVARGNDLWLHARDVAGSHVILRRRGAEPSHEALLDAALLAAWHSRARGEAVVDVMWTERKHVRKPKGAAPGRVTAAATRTVTVRPDPTRLERLYASLDSRGGSSEPSTSS